MAYLAVQSWGDEMMFHNCPTRKENKYWQDDEVYDEIRRLTTCAEDYSIVLPKGTIKKLIGRDMTWEDKPVDLLTGEDINIHEWKQGDIGYFFETNLWKTVKVVINDIMNSYFVATDEDGFKYRISKDDLYATEKECELNL